MGHFLLTNLILRENLMSDRSRIVCLSSHGHYSGKINFDDLNWTKKYSGYYAYAQSKLANILFARELDRRLKEQGQKITAVSCHPGMGKSILNLPRKIQSDLGSDKHPVNRKISLVKPFLLAQISDIIFMGGIYNKEPYSIIKWQYVMSDFFADTPKKTEPINQSVKILNLRY